jgi:hypothetical protein
VVENQQNRMQRWTIGGIAAAFLCRLYLAWLGRFARRYIDSQEPEGFWHPWKEERLGDIIEITLKYVMHIATLTGAISSRPAPILA